MAPSTSHKTIVRAFRLLERAAPGVGERWAARLWFTAPPPLPLDRLPVPPPGEEVGVELDGRRLRATAWGSGPLVLLLHGWGGRSEQLGAFVAPLVAAGHRVVALPPTLVVHDHGDREVGFRDGHETARAWPGARLLATEGLGHRRLLRDPAVVEEVVAFVAAPVPAAPGRRSA
jgi:hypothetical protein